MSNTKTIEVSQETYEKIKDQLLAEETLEVNTFEDLVGKKFFFRTVTYHLVGKVKKYTPPFLELENASWVASSGRFHKALATGELDEVEPCGNSGVAFINLTHATTDFFPWEHELPTQVK